MLKKALHTTLKKTFHTTVNKFFTATWNYVPLKKREIWNQEIETLLLRVKTLASISVKVRRENAKLLTPILQNVWPYSHSGVDNFSHQQLLLFVVISEFYF